MTVKKKITTAQDAGRSAKALFKFLRLVVWILPAPNLRLHKDRGSSSCGYGEKTEGMVFRL